MAFAPEVHTAALLASRIAAGTYSGSSLICITRIIASRCIIAGTTV